MKYFIISIIIVQLFSSCYYKYYNTTDQKPYDTVKLRENIIAGNRIYIHGSGNTVAAQGVVIEQNAIRAKALPLTDIQKKYLSPAKGKPNRILKDEENEVLNASHIYTSVPIADTGKISISLPKIDRIVLYEYDKEKSKKSKAGASVATSIAALALIGGITAVVVVSSNTPSF